MQVSEILMETSAESCQLKGRIILDHPSREFRLTHTFPREFAAWMRPTANPFLAALLIPSMRSNQPLTVDAPASKKFFENLPQIMSLYHSWSGKFRKIKVNVSGTVSHGSKPGGARALFFSGGVDSFYTLLSLNTRSTESLSHLVFVSGLDIPVFKKALLDEAYRAVTDVAGTCGKRLISATTNAREITEQFVEWNMCHGSILASVALSLDELLHTVYYASDQEANSWMADGCHPNLDPLWSTESTTFVHYGSDTRRFQRVAAIAKSHLAQKYLRVCFENRGGAYNCCKCRKCIQTMLELKVAEALPDFITFPHQLTPQLVRGQYISPPVMPRARNDLRKLRLKGEKELADAYAHAMKVSEIKRPIVDTVNWLQFALKKRTSHPQPNKMHKEKHPLILP